MKKKNVKKKKRLSKHTEPLGLTRIVKNWQIYVFLLACIYQLYSRKIYSEIGQLYIDCYNIDLFMTTNCRKPKGKNIFFAWSLKMLAEEIQNLIFFFKKKEFIGAHFWGGNGGSRCSLCVTTALCVCVSVCVRERERQIDRKIDRWIDR